MPMKSFCLALTLSLHIKLGENEPLD